MTKTQAELAVLKRQIEVANRKQRHLYDEVHEANNANEKLHKQVLEMQQSHKTEISALRDQLSEAKHSREADRTQFKVSGASRRINRAMESFEAGIVVVLVIGYL